MQIILSSFRRCHCNLIPHKMETKIENWIYFKSQEWLPYPLKRLRDPLNVKLIFRSLIIRGMNCFDGLVKLRAYHTIHSHWKNVFRFSSSFLHQYWRGERRCVLLFFCVTCNAHSAIESTNKNNLTFSIWKIKMETWDGDLNDSHEQKHFVVFTLSVRCTWTK